MSAGAVWLISTGVLWAICTAAMIVIEAYVHGYRTQFAAMIATGAAIGALASAVGYSFFVLAAVLVAQTMLLRRRLLRFVRGDQRAATKYIALSAAFLVAAVVGSYVFSLEVCEGLPGCRRVFFERIYTPPHLVPPVGA